MLSDGEDDENSISTGLFLSVFLKKYMVHCNQSSESHRDPSPSSCTVAVWMGLITLAEER